IAAESAHLQDRLARAARRKDWPKVLPELQFLAGHGADQPFLIRVGHATRRDLPAGSEDSVIIADRKTFLHLVRDEDDCMIAIPECRDYPKDTVDLSLGEGRSRLVKDQHFHALVGGGAGDLQKLLVGN